MNEKQAQEILAAHGILVALVMRASDDGYRKLAAANLGAFEAKMAEALRGNPPSDLIPAAQSIISVLKEIAP